MSKAIVHCRSCKAEMFWVKTAKGKAMPLDATPVADGNIELRGEPPNQVAHYLSIGEIQDLHLAASKAGLIALFYKSHFATCPQSNKWRKNQHGRHAT